MKTTVHFEAVCGRKFMSFQDGVADPLQFATHLPLMYTLFRSVDTGR